ncbi:MAG TPA: hypothetical protein VMC05_03720 [Xanthobacteraceae bacterium]|nr:hypothetical protein [Xanthobacteraceae bacterium]
MKYYVAVALTFSGLLCVPAAARSDAQEDQSACMVDAQTYCGQFIPDRVRVAHCLIANRRKISPACRQAVRHFH